MKKKILTMLLAGTLMLSAGCGSSAASDAVSDTESVTEAASTETEATDSEPYGDVIVYDASEYVTLGDYMGLEVEVEGNYDVTEDDIKNEVELELGYLGTSYEETDKKTVEDGDTVNIDYVGKKDGVAFDGGTAEGYNLTIGSGSFIPGFEDGLIGANVGDVVDLNLTFPEEYHSEELAGADVVFTVTVNSIVEPVTVAYEDLTDEFVKENMGVDTVEEYLKQVRETMEEDKESEKETAVSRAVLLRLPEVCTVSGHPEGLEEERIEQNIQYYRNMAEAYGTDLETMLSSYNMTEEGLREDLAETVKDSVDIEIILLAIADAEGITEDEDAYQEYVAEAIEQGGYKDEAELYSEYSEEYVRRQFRQDKARELVTDNAKITFKDTASSESTEAVDTTESVEETEN